MKQCLLYTNYTVNPPNFSDVNCNSREIMSAPLVVNCANCTNTDQVQAVNYNETGRLDYYFLYLLSPNLVVEAMNQRQVMCEGDLVVIPPKTGYKMYATKGDCIYYLCVHFTGYDAEKKLKEYGIEQFPSLNRLSSKNTLQAKFKRLFDAFAINDEYQEKELANLLERIFIETARAIKLEKGNKGAILSKSIRYINEYYTTQIKIPDLAKMENMCVTAYNLEFKKEMGMPPTKYIIKLRMTHAIELLETTNLSIKEISLTCGYTDVNFFSRVFKSYTGYPPNAYRIK